jgi:voltage-gated potassium channel Kch
MPIYRFVESRLGRLRVREWRRRAMHTLGLLLLALLGCMSGLVVLDPTPQPFARKAFAALWNASNLISTLGDFTAFSGNQRTFMIVAMFTFLSIGAFAVSRLTGILASDAVLAHRENRLMDRILDRLAGHVVMVGFGAVGRLVASRLQSSGERVLLIERDANLAAQASELGFLVLQGDAGVDPDVLNRARIETARALVVTTEDPDRKLAITLLAHTLNPQLTIAATGQNDPRGALLQRAGASEVVVVEDLVADALLDRLAKTSGA